MSHFEKFNLDEKILKVLQDIKYEVPTAIQEQAIPRVLEGCDLIASAQTGTGKTGAFMLPILHRLEMNPVEKHIKPRALILVPTRELALQVSEEAKKYSKYLPHIRTVCIYGGVPYPIQKKSLSNPYDVLIATPGRLIDHLDQQRIDLSNVETLVLDEADRMLDMGFIDDVEQITTYIPKKRQTLLFSATIDNKILPISRKLQNNPFEIRVKQDLSLKDNIEASLYYVDDINHKMKLMDHFLENLEMTQMIIFTSTIVQTKALARYLQEKDFLAGALHGDMDQKQRTKTINRLRKGSIQILVATDVAARGIDIASLSHVINFDLPFQSEDFVHRIGRTGRAGAKGAAITFATYKESLMMSRIEKLIGKPLPTLTVEGLEPKPKTRENSQPIQRRGRRSRGRGSEQNETRHSHRRNDNRKDSFRDENSFAERESFNRPTKNKSAEQFFVEKQNDFKKPFKSKPDFRKLKEENFEDRRSSFRKPFKQEESFEERKSFRRSFNDETERKPSFRKPFKQEGSFDERKSSFRKPFKQEGSFEERKSFRKPFKQEGSFEERKSFRKPFKQEGSFEERKSSFRKPFKQEGSFEEKKSSFKKPFKQEGSFGQRESSFRKPFKQEGSFEERKSSFKKPFRQEGTFEERKNSYRNPKDSEKKRSFSKPSFPKKSAWK